MASPLIVAGVDSSTQSCKFITVDAATGEILASTSRPHPDGTTVDPQSWWDAFTGVQAQATPDIKAVSISAQQHTTIWLDAASQPLGEAVLWNDLRAAKQASDLRHEFGSERWVREMGMLPTAAHPVAKLRWLAETSPEVAVRVRHVLLPHDWLTWKLLGCEGEPTTDRSDASGTGYWAPSGQGYREDLLELAFSRAPAVPRVLGPAARAGITKSGIVVGAGCGDNAAAALGLGIEPGEAVVSVGTSMTVSMVHSGHVADPSGHVADMADASGMQLPIVATLNGARTLLATSRMLGCSLGELDELAMTADLDAQGVYFLPYLDGERTPLMPHSSGALMGLTRSSMIPGNIARAAILGLACAIADAIDDLRRAGLEIEKITLVGGGSQSRALRQAVADLTGRSVGWPLPREYAALGAARQAAWALTGELPQWQRPESAMMNPGQNLGWTSAVRQRHQQASAILFGQH